MKIYLAGHGGGLEKEEIKLIAVGIKNRLLSFFSISCPEFYSEKGIFKLYENLLGPQRPLESKRNVFN
jgi:hypothetical protein